MRLAPILAGAGAGAGVFLYRWNVLSGKGGTSMDDAWGTVYLGSAATLVVVIIGEVLVTGAVRRSGSHPRGGLRACGSREDSSQNRS